MRLDLIPRMDVPPTGPRPVSKVRDLIPALDMPRRTLVKGVVLGALAATLVPFDRLFRRLGGPTSEWTRANCSDAYPGGYEQGRSNWWRGPAICFGGWRMGAYPCNAKGRHFEGARVHNNGEERYSSFRIDSACGESTTRNAWRWSHRGGAYRCSDASTKVTWRDGSSHRDLTISVCKV